MDRERDEEIRKRAHQLWENDGRPEGRESEHWQRAAQELDGSERASGTGSQREPLSEASRSSKAAEDLKSGGDKKRR